MVHPGDQFAVDVAEIHFVTFGGGRHRYRAAARRLGARAIRTGAFAEVSALTHHDLDSSFRVQHEGILHATTRGYGYWIWKPHIISRSLEIGRSEFVLYADAGCTVNLDNPAAVARLGDYLDMAAEHAVCSFVMHQQPESKWTKRDLLSLGDISAEHEESGQRVAGVILFKRCDAARNLVGTWKRIAEMDNYHFLDDSPSGEPENACFVEHRHDQSILSCVLKSAGVPGIADETYFGGDWHSAGRDFPLWATRNFPSWAKSTEVPRRIRALARSVGSGHQPKE